MTSALRPSIKNNLTTETVFPANPITSLPSKIRPRKCGPSSPASALAYSQQAAQKCECPVAPRYLRSSVSTLLVALHSCALEYRHPKPKRDFPNVRFLLGSHRWYQQK